LPISSGPLEYKPHLFVILVSQCHKKKSEMYLQDIGRKTSEAAEFEPKFGSLGGIKQSRQAGYCMHPMCSRTKCKELWMGEDSRSEIVVESMAYCLTAQQELQL